MDTLGDLSDASDASDTDEDERQAQRPRKTARTECEVDPEALVCGASVLFVPEPKTEGEQDWGW